MGTAQSDVTTIRTPGTGYAMPKVAKGFPFLVEITEIIVSTSFTKLILYLFFNGYICYSPAGRSVLGETVPEVLSTARI